MDLLSSRYGKYEFAEEIALFEAEKKCQQKIWDVVQVIWVQLQKDKGVTFLTRRLYLEKFQKWAPRRCGNWMLGYQDNLFYHQTNAG